MMLDDGITFFCLGLMCLLCVSYKLIFVFFVLFCVINQISKININKKLILLDLFELFIHSFN